MFRIIARLCVLTCCGLFVSLGSFAEETPKPTPTPNGNNCAFVNIYIHGESLPKVENRGVACKHGDLAQITQMSPKDVRVILKQSLTWGPDCSITITFDEKPHPVTAVVHVQQNYCGVEAGNLDPDVISGPVRIEKYEAGSYEGNQPGQVWFAQDKKGGKSPR